MARNAPDSARRRQKRAGKNVAPERAETALLLIDVINDFDFRGSAELLKFALPAAKRIDALKRRLRAARVPALYVNDNFGRWQSDFRKQVDRCLADDCPGAPIARMLLPAADDYFVLKPRHSGFYATSLEVLLSFLGARTLILTGFATDICVLFTANDAFMRGYKLLVPSDCVAAETLSAQRTACAQMKRFLHADTRTSRMIQVPKN